MSTKLHCDQDGNCYTDDGSLNALEEFFVTQPAALVLIVIYITYWVCAGWIVVFQYKNRIVDNRPQHRPRTQDKAFLKNIERAPLRQLAEENPTTLFHFIVCYSIRVADTFSSTRVTSFWSAYFTVLYIAPFFWCYVPLMRAYVRDQLGGSWCEWTDCLICLCPWTHFVCCYGFREAVAMDEATEVHVIWPCDVMVGFETRSEMARSETARLPTPQKFHTKIDAGGMNYTVGEPIKVAAARPPPSATPPDGFESSPINMAPSRPNLAGFRLKQKTTQAKEEKEDEYRPIDRPQCFTFIETGKCKYGAGCYWKHGANQDRKNMLDCPKKHGVRRICVDAKVQCNSCQNLIFVGERAYACTSCSFSVCLICRATFTDVAQPQEVD
eukprot:GEMP01039329.1.p1 GENE.GEMP01039329.1~~GEMP01039329.1.p1  ORF type:complete len:383 (+),score=64.58 GEMP01039329.1:87-1235(+)